MIELHVQPPLFRLLALATFAFSLLFHVIAFCTTYWCHVVIDNRQFNIGVWEGCERSSITNKWLCSSDIFKHEVFTVNKWHIGIQMLTTCSLLVLVLQEFIIVSYVCIKCMHKYKQKLANAVLASSMLLGTFMLLTLLLVRTNAAEITNGRVGWSFGMEVIGLIFTILTPMVLYMEKLKDKISCIPTDGNWTQHYLSIFKLRKDVMNSKLNSNPLNTEINIGETKSNTNNSLSETQSSILSLESLV